MQGKCRLRLLQLLRWHLLHRILLESLLARPELLMLLDALLSLLVPQVDRLDLIEDVLALLWLLLLLVWLVVG